MGDSLCLPLLCAFSLTMRCSDFLALHAPRLSPPCLNHLPSHQSLNKMHEHTPMLDNPGRKKQWRVFLQCEVSTSFSVITLYWSSPPSLCLYLVSCSLWITSPQPPLLLFYHFILSYQRIKTEEWPGLHFSLPCDLYFSTSTPKTSTFLINPSSLLEGSCQHTSLLSF